MQSWHVGTRQPAGVSIDMESQYKAAGSDEWGEIRCVDALGFLAILATSINEERSWPSFRTSVARLRNGFQVLREQAGSLSFNLSHFSRE